MRGDLNVTTAPSTARGRITRGPEWLTTDGLIDDAFAALCRSTNPDAERRQRRLMRVVECLRAACLGIVEEVDNEAR